MGDSAKSADIDADVDLLIEKFDDVKLGEVADKVKDADAASVKSTFVEVAKELVGAGSLDASYLKYFN